MRKLSVLLGTFITLTCAGCSEDPNDLIIRQTISITNGTASEINIIAKGLGDAVAQAKSDKKPLDSGKIAEAIKQVADSKNRPNYCR